MMASISGQMRDSVSDQCSAGVSGASWVGCRCRTAGRSGAEMVLAAPILPTRQRRGAERVGGDAQ